MNIALLLLATYAQTGGVPSTPPCPLESLLHARKIYAPIPNLRDLTPACHTFGAPTLRLQVERNGRVSEVKFLKRTRCKSADRKLLECIRHWRYEPAMCGEKFIPETITLTINWEFEERQTEDPCRPEPENVRDAPKGELPP